MSLCSIDCLKCQITRFSLGELKDFETFISSVEGASDGGFTNGETGMGCTSKSFCFRDHT